MKRLTKSEEIVLLHMVNSIMPFTAVHGEKHDRWRQVARNVSDSLGCEPGVISDRLCRDVGHRLLKAFHDKMQDSPEGEALDIYSMDERNRLCAEIQRKIDYFRGPFSHATSSNTNPSFEVTLNRMTSTTLTGRPLSSSSLCLSDSMPFCRCSNTNDTHANASTYTNPNPGTIHISTCPHSQGCSSNLDLHRATLSREIITTREPSSSAPYTLDPLSPTGNYRQDRVHLPHTRVRSFGNTDIASSSEKLTHKRCRDFDDPYKVGLDDTHPNSWIHHDSSSKNARTASHDASPLDECDQGGTTLQSPHSYRDTRARMNDEDISAGHSYEHAYSPRCHQRSFSAQHQYPLSRHRHPKTHPNMLPTVYIQSDLAQHQIRRSISDAIDTPNDVFTDDLPRIMHMSNTASPLKRSLDKPSSAHTLIGAEEGSPTTSDLRPQDHSGSFLTTDTCANHCSSHQARHGMNPKLSDTIGPSTMSAITTANTTMEKITTLNTGWLDPCPSSDNSNLTPKSCVSDPSNPDTVLANLILLMTTVISKQSEQINLMKKNLGHEATARSYLVSTLTKLFERFPAAFGANNKFDMHSIMDRTSQSATLDTREPLGSILPSFLELDHRRSEPTGDEFQRSAIQKSRLRLLGHALDPGVENVYTWLRGGVINGEADLDQQWLDGTMEHESMGTRHDNLALAARLADFLQVAYRQYQSTLWKYHRDRLVGVG
ncbi:hypothetical protein BASA50_004580 [Batrachochytrium salamandrivorans]|uniref:Uncharacterized protein n=1 Tax=Batrachochytrium salamandrivorans TaxID=1357716 RepID=A0ABQ8FF29_9FUNG|nr:hypothetical protein BASA50_004580 [Batrachochytrium salamandrivorans]